MVDEDASEKQKQQQFDADYVVEQAVERAAVKVAAAVPIAKANGTPVLSKMGSIVAVIIIVLVELSNFFLNIQTKNEVTKHQKDFKTLCQVFVDLTPPERARDLAERFAECLK